MKGYRRYPDEVVSELEKRADDNYIFFERKPAESRTELIQKLMGKRQVLTSYVNKHKRDRIAGKHVIAYLEQKETEELALVQATLTKLFTE
jgi:hypothetical protein